MDSEMKLKKTIEWLYDDIHIFRSHYLMCNFIEKNIFRKGLIRYKNRFDNEKDFMFWYLQIVK